MNFLSDPALEISGGEIDLTPLIDVVFLLLIFFMVSTTFLDSPGIDVNLPRASANAAIQRSEEVTVTVDSKGRIYLKDREVSLIDLSSHFRRTKQQAADATLILRADTSTSHGRVVHVMDAAQSAGIERIAIATQQ